MPDRLLVDTSAWIASFRKAGQEKLKQLLIAALDTRAVTTTNIIVLELLQGCGTRNEFAAMQSRLEALEPLPLNEAVWSLAYSTGYELRRKGFTVSTVDIIIAAAAKIHGCALLHHDRHFRALAKHLHIQATDFIDD